jgi:hypothetical protein
LQEKYINEVLERFGKADCRPISTPSTLNEHLLKLDSPETNVKLYQSVISVLMYSMLETRPNLAYTIAALGRHTASPGDEHLRALDRAFQYLQATSDRCLFFQQETQDGTRLHGYVNTDWASNVNNRKSTSGFIFMLAGRVISWSSKKQQTVALSSTKAEYIAGAHAAKEATWLKSLVSEIWKDQKIDPPIILYIDNQSAMSIAKNSEFHDCTKHINVRHHFLWQQVDLKAITLKYMPTNDQVADVLTKGLPCKKHDCFMASMGVHCVGWGGMLGVQPHKA